MAAIAQRHTYHALTDTSPCTVAILNQNDNFIESCIKYINSNISNTKEYY